jgi:hypothetical protein
MAYQEVLFGADIPQNNNPLHYSSSRNRFKMERLVSFIMVIYTKVRLKQGTRIV